MQPDNYTAASMPQPTTPQPPTQYNGGGPTQWAI
jgi:hypothetical protein